MSRNLFKTTCEVILKAFFTILILVAIVGCDSPAPDTQENQDFQTGAPDPVSLFDSRLFNAPSEQWVANNGSCDSPFTISTYKSGEDDLLVITEADYCSTPKPSGNKRFILKSDGTLTTTLTGKAVGTMTSNKIVYSTVNSVGGCAYDLVIELLDDNSGTMSETLTNCTSNYNFSTTLTIGIK